MRALVVLDGILKRPPSPSSTVLVYGIRGDQRHRLERLRGRGVRGERRIDVTPILTHRFTLEEYREAFLACGDQGKTGAVKVLFSPRP